MKYGFGFTPQVSENSLGFNKHTYIIPIGKDASFILFMSNRVR